MFKQLAKADRKRAVIIGMFATGASCIVRGSWMIYPPAAFLVAGCLLISLAVGFVIAPVPAK